MLQPRRLKSGSFARLLTWELTSTFLVGGGFVASVRKRRHQTPCDSAQSAGPSTCMTNERHLKAGNGVAADDAAHLAEAEGPASG